MQKVIAFLKKKDLYIGIARYLLATDMFFYAISKILRTQFVLIPFSSLQMPLERLNGRNLAWAFLGYSPWFQVLLGVLELIPSILLLFRRTTLLGGILMLPMVLNVFLINHALDLWDGTKTISLQLLIINLIVLAFEWKRIWAFILIVIGKGIKLKYYTVEMLINAVLIGGMCYLAFPKLLEYRAEHNFLTGDWLNHQPNEWTLKSETVGDTVHTPRVSKLYFGAYGQYSELKDTGYMVNAGLLTYRLYEKQHQFTMLDSKDKVFQVFKYTLLGDTAMRAETMIDSAKHIKMVRVYRKRIMHVGAKE